MERQSTLETGVTLVIPLLGNSVKRLPSHSIPGSPYLNAGEHEILRRVRGFGVPELNGVRLEPLDLGWTDPKNGS